MRIIGFGVIRLKKQQGSRKPAYYVSYDSYKNVVTIKDLIWPWLGQVKREQFRFALEKYESLAVKLTEKEEK